MTSELRPASGRFRTVASGRETRHSFSFGAHYDPANLGFGPLLCHNDDAVRPGAGYPDHPHTDLEIVTWVLDGALTHTDSAGVRGVIEPGTVQVLSAGSGIVHSETVDAASGPTRFLQVWVRPDTWDTAPSYATAPVADALATGELVPVVSGRRDDALTRIGNSATTLHIGRLAAGRPVALPDDPLLHVYVARGAVRLESGLLLGEADALRITDEPGQTLTPQADTELLIWSFTR